jgi:nucleoside-diphosphate-sugar epimerase
MNTLTACKIETIALTGATSMIGVALIKQCLKNNIKVLAFARKNSPRVARIPKSDLITVVNCDLNELNLFDDSSKTADVFYHIGWTNTQRKDFNSCYDQLKNVQYTLDAVHLAKKLGCGKFLGTGTQAEHECSTLALSSNSPIDPGTGYGIAKYAAGKLSKIECGKYSLEYNWVRILYVYGINYNEDTVIMSFIRNCKTGRYMKLSDCTQVIDYLYEDDAGRALFLLGKKGIDGKTYVLGSGTGRPLKEYIEIIRNIINPDYTPGYGKIPYSENPARYLCADISELSRDTGWKPDFSFEDGVKNILRYRYEKTLPSG